MEAIVKYKRPVHNSDYKRAMTHIRNGLSTTMFDCQDCGVEYRVWCVDENGKKKETICNSRINQYYEYLRIKLCKLDHDPTWLDKDDNET